MRPPDNAWHRRSLNTYSGPSSHQTASLNAAASVSARSGQRLRHHQRAVDALGIPQRPVPARQSPLAARLPRRGAASRGTCPAHRGGGVVGGGARRDRQKRPAEPSCLYRTTLYRTAQRRPTGRSRPGRRERCQLPAAGTARTARWVVMARTRCSPLACRGPSDRRIRALRCTGRSRRRTRYCLM
jgi:hypothetical protein